MSGQRTPRLQDRRGRARGRSVSRVTPTEVALLLQRAERVTVLTGAGISTGSGIPDFRGPQGVWTLDPSAARLHTLADYLQDPEVRRRSWQARAAHPAWHARPNAAHRALVTLERAGRLRALLTQNIDGLHQAAGSSPELVLELHGTVHETVCLRCGLRAPMRQSLDRVAAGEDDPACAACGGILKSATVSFGQHLDQELMRRARAAAADCDVFVAVGTSLGVQPAASLCRVATRAGARLVVLNAQPTPYDEVALLSGGAVLRDDVEELVPRLVADLPGRAPVPATLRR